MPTSADSPDALVDTSIAIPLVVPDHAHYEVVTEAVGDRVLGLAGHAAFETFSVLTRLPPPARLTPGAAVVLISTNFPHTAMLSSPVAEKLLADLASMSIAGGSVYDALVGAAAREQGVPLLTRDHRAIGTYRSLGVDFELIA